MSNEQLINEKIDQINALKKEVLELQSNVFDGATKSLFEDFPRVKFIGWSQYTPYFNDGDPCVFSVNTPQFIVDISENNDVEFDADENELSEVIRDEDAGNKEVIVLDEWSVKNYNGGRDHSDDFWIDYYKDKYERVVAVMGENALLELTKRVMELHRVIENAEDTLEERFGDGVMVIVSKDGIETEEYDHD